MNNPLKSQIAANRERFDEKIANRLYTLSFTKEMGDFLTTSQTSLLQTAIAAVEGLKIEHPTICKVWSDEDTHCTCDFSPYTVNSTLSKVVELLRGGIEII